VVLLCLTPDRNLNATTAEGCDVGNSNPFYHWGALSGYIAMREAMADQSFAATILEAEPPKYNV
jgi:hypothetical protein